MIRQSRNSALGRQEQIGFGNRDHLCNGDHVVCARQDMSFIYTDSNRTTLSSYDLDKMKKNADGSVTIFSGPKAPNGLESNWLPTAGHRPLPAMRCYGPTEALNNRTFKLPDFELVG